jgi:nitroreductase
METIKAIDTRRSVRSFKDRPVEKEKLEKLVLLADHAPQAGVNNIYFAVVTDKSYLDEIDEVTYQEMLNGNDFQKSRVAMPGYRPLYGAPALIICASDPGRGTANAAAAATTICYAANDMGLGSCYLGGIPQALAADKKLAEKLNLPEGMTPLAGVALGYTEDPEKFGKVRIYGGNASWVE